MTSDDRREAKREHMARVRQDPERAAAERERRRAAYRAAVPGSEARIHRSWSTDDDAEILRRYADGEDVATIARAVGRSREATRKRIKAIAGDEERLAWRARQADMAATGQDEEIVRRALAGESVSEIARALGRTYRSVVYRRQVLRAAGRIPTKVAVRGVQGASVDPTETPGVEHVPFEIRIREAGRRHGYRSDLR